jgi:hypothetical protein
MLSPPAPRRRLEHAALVTASSTISARSTSTRAGLDTPFTEDQPRPRDRFVHAGGHTVCGQRLRAPPTKVVGETATINRPRAGQCHEPRHLARQIYATLCRRPAGRSLSRSPQQYAGLVDMTDAQLLAHLVWEATTRPPTRRSTSSMAMSSDERCGDIAAFRDRCALSRTTGPLACLGRRPVDWERIVGQYRLKPNRSRRSRRGDAIRPRRTQECMADMSRAAARLLACQPTWPSFVDLFGRLRKRGSS